MKDRKRRLETYSFYDHSGIETHLRTMAQKGWLLDKIGTWGWIYRRITPADLHFGVSYFPKASEFDPEPTPEQKEFQEFCEHTGWKFICSSAQMQIFVNDGENPVSIETDPQLEVETIHKAAKKSYLPAQILLLTIAIMSIGLFLSDLSRDPISLLVDAARQFSVFCYFCLLFICLFEIIRYFHWRKKAVKAADHGEFLETKSFPALQKTILVIVMLALLYWITSQIFGSDKLMAFISILAVGYMVMLIVLVNGIKIFLKRRKASRGVNRTITILSAFIFAYALIGGMVFFTIRLNDMGWFENAGKSEPQYPLRMEDLLKEPMTGYVMLHSGHHSPVLSQDEYFERRSPEYQDDKEKLHLTYSITSVHLPFLYDFCKSALIEKEKDSRENDEVVFINHYEQIDPAPWGAKDAYQLHWSDSVMNSYLLCYDTHFVKINFDWEPTEEQIAIAAELLGK